MFIIFLLSLSFFEGTGQKVLIPGGTIIEIELGENVNSSHNNTGDQITFLVHSDIKIDGKTVIAKGAIAKGKVKRVREGDAGGTGGELNLIVKNVIACDGSLVKTVWDPITAEGKTKKANAFLTNTLTGGLAKGKGEEAILFSGEIFEIETRTDSFIEVYGAKTHHLNAQPKVEHEVSIKKPFKVNLSSKQPPQEVVVKIPKLKTMTMVSVLWMNGYQLPSPIATRVLYGKGKVSFGWWDFFKYTRNGENVAIIKIHNSASGKDLIQMNFYCQFK